MRQPFCERCKGWFAKPERLVAVAPASAGAAVVAALETGNPYALGQAWSPFDASKPFIALGIRSCPKCPSGRRFVDVAKITVKGGKTKRKSLRKGLVDAGKLDAQLAGLVKAADKAQPKPTADPAKLTP